MSVNLVTCNVREFAEVMAKATRLGTDDHRLGIKPRTGKQLVREYAVSWRNGHVRPIKAAYEAGRFHADAQQADELRAERMATRSIAATL